MNEIFVLMINKFHYLQMGYFYNMFSRISATKTMIRLLESKSLFKELNSLFRKIRCESFSGPKKILCKNY